MAPSCVLIFTTRQSVRRDARNRHPARRRKTAAKRLPFQCRIAQVQAVNQPLITPFPFDPAGGFNLPTAPDLRLTGIEFVLFAPNAQLIQTFAFHATLMSILFTVVMISSESFRIPVAFRKEKGKGGIFRTFLFFALPRLRA
ncbi:hypothetical protein CA13_73770 [Planctomycetes bacterium CA13]|uniref:Uncharacterized protein n=1 Tax=Novipirellula herctigrandis TaxID=2527986 RepID=A0A5C5YLH8_9BACT|nr:hypothetical protein CA13_73770 [Planctomycetes bacterium CA13]